MPQTFGMDPVTVQQKGKKLQNNAATLSTELSKLTKNNTDLRKVWNGEDADKYFRMWEEKRESINKLQEWLSNFADATVASGAKTSETADNLSSMMR